MNKSPFLVSISGGSGSGKSTLTDYIQRSCPEHVSVLALDHYYKDLSHISPAQRDDINFDNPKALDHLLLEDHICHLKEGRTILRPSYDFITHTRTQTHKVNITPAKLIILDGIFNLYFENLRPHYDLSLFIDTSPDLRLARRLHRDTKERGRHFSGVLEQYLKTVKPMYEAYIEPTKYFADFIIHGDSYTPEKIIHFILNIAHISEYRIC